MIGVLTIMLLLAVPLAYRQGRRRGWRDRGEQVRMALREAAHATAFWLAESNRRVAAAEQRAADAAARQQRRFRAVLREARWWKSAARSMRDGAGE